MRLHNQSKMSTSDLRKWLKFAARGTRDSGVDVIVNDNFLPFGWAYDLGQRTYPPKPRISEPPIPISKTAKWLVILNTPSNPVVQKRTFTDMRSIKKLWPKGLPLEEADDYLVWLAAHEFRHVWQYQRTDRTGKMDNAEYEAEKFSMRGVNEWREHTGRKPTPAIKQPNPFAYLLKR